MVDSNEKNMEMRGIDPRFFLKAFRILYHLSYVPFYNKSK